MNQQIFGHHIGHVRIIPATGHRQPFEVLARGCDHPDKQTVDRILDRLVVINLRPNPGVIRRVRDLLVLRSMEIGFQAAIGIHRERRVRAVLNHVVRQCGTRIGQMQRRDHLRNSRHDYLTTPVLQLGVIHVIQEDAFVLIEKT